MDAGLEGIGAFSLAFCAPASPGTSGVLASSGVSHGGQLGDGSGQAVDQNTLFDLASVTKLFTATLVLLLQQNGVLALGQKVKEFFPKNRSELAAADATLTDLLLHRSGLPATSDLWKTALFADGTPDVQRAQELLLASPLEHEPGAKHVYSCVGYATAGLIVERATGQSLDQVLAALVVQPLGLESLQYQPDPARASIAATEVRPAESAHRPGLCQGEVHDEMAWALGGVSGNAGLFSTAADLLVFAKMLANRGEHDGSLFLSEDTWRLMSRAPRLDARADYQQALGPRLGMRSLTGSDRLNLVGHTGYTGTALVADTDTGGAVVALTNGSYPDRSLTPVAPRLLPLMREKLQLRDDSGFALGHERMPRP